MAELLKGIKELPLLHVIPTMFDIWVGGAWKIKIQVIINTQPGHNNLFDFQWLFLNLVTWHVIVKKSRSGLRTNRI